MSVELVGLAYDQDLTNAVWSKMTARDAFDLVLDDEFRRKVDFRSMLYHKGQSELLSEFEPFLRQGGEKHTLVELMAARFKAGVEEYPNPAGEFAFDFQLIRYFASLAMVDDFLTADPFLRELLRKVGFLKTGKAWSLLEVKDFESVVRALRDARMQDILDASRVVQQQDETLSFVNLVRNYIEFLNYTQNNGLTPFFYNSQTDFRQWGNLSERKNERNEVIVDLSLAKKRKARTKPTAKKKIKKTKKIDLEARMKVRREVDALLGGLKDSDPLIRQKTAESLGRLAEPDILPHLVEALSDSEPEVRQEIVRAIGAIPLENAEDALLKVLREDEVFSVRLIAAHTLRRRGAKKAIPLLLDAIEAGKPYVGTILAYHSQLKSDRFALARLKGMVQHQSAAVRREAAFILGRLPDRVSQASLLHLAKDVDPETQCNALYSLWSIGSPKARTMAKELSSSKSKQCQQAGTIVYSWGSQRA